MRKILSFAIIVLMLIAIAFAQEKPKEPEPITLEALQVRMETLRKGREQAIANVNAYDGAIQECEFWIEQLKPKETQKDEPKRVSKPDTK